MAPASVVKYRMQSVFKSLAAGSLGIAALASPVVAAEPWPTQGQAGYKIEFSGFDVGTFEFKSSVNGPSYTVTGDAKLSALLGAFKWRGETRSSGALAGD